MSETIAEKLVTIAENEVKLYNEALDKGYTEGYGDGYDKAKSEQKTEVEKSVTITENGTRTFTPNSNETFSSVEVTVDVPDKNGSYDEGYNQGLIDGEKPEVVGEYEVTENKEYTFTPDGNNVFSKVKVNVNVEGSNNLSEYLEGKTTDLYCDDVKKLIGSAFPKHPMTSARFLALTEIGVSAFDQCSNLVSIDMPEATTIMASAFYSCGKLALTELPPKLSRIMANSFQNCSSLAITHIPASVVAILGSSFSGCSGLTSITFKGKPNTIYNTAFSGCTNLTTINCPWAEGAVKNAPWGATNATINYNYTGG